MLYVLNVYEVMLIINIAGKLKSGVLSLTENN